LTSQRADLGFAFDGDADRALAVDITMSNGSRDQPFIWRGSSFVK